MDNVSPAKTVALSGVGINPVGVSPPGLDFGIQPVGTINSRTMTLTSKVHYGIGMYTHINGDSSVWSESDNCGEEISNCTVTVTFAPKAMGRTTAALGISSADYDPPCYGWCYETYQEVPLTGFGTLVILTPASLKFGDQRVGTMSAAQMITLTNNTGGPISIYGIHLRGSITSLLPNPTTVGLRWLPWASCTIIGDLPAADYL